MTIPWPEKGHVAIKSSNCCALWFNELVGGWDEPMPATVFPTGPCFASRTRTVSRSFWCSRTLCCSGLDFCLACWKNVLTSFRDLCGRGDEWHSVLLVKSAAIRDTFFSEVGPRSILPRRQDHEIIGCSRWSNVHYYLIVTISYIFRTISSTYFCSLRNPCYMVTAFIHRECTKPVFQRRTGIILGEWKSA